ncbi:integrase [Mycoplana sp. BE70]|uniref:tyrosine-type recombinase/integrase n=1 Tax=Mycoplana sp. BE70 TaxID=2817775 RepID=UPI00285EABFB|nr:tyrosine-type recombinase/integrase [Mycoplana sp. BE70]MDR6755192.1 integrase [Mycoplana sp. BE70]
MPRQGSSIPQFVKRIPADIKPQLIGKELVIPLGETAGTASCRITASSQSIRFSLRASTPSDAKKRQAAALEYVEEVFAALREERPASLTRSQVAALAGELYHSWAKEADDSRTIAFIEQDGRMVRTYRVDDDELSLGLEAAARYVETHGDSDLEADLERLVGSLADKLIVRKGIMRVDDKTRTLLLQALPRSLSEGMEAQRKIINGDFRPDDNAARFPVWEAPAMASQPTNGVRPAKVSLNGLVESWWIEAKAAGKSESTHESYSNTVRLFSAFLGHDDALRITPEDVVRYKDHRLSAINPKTKKPVSAKTVKASDLTALKSVFDWAVTNLKVPSNPASGVTIKLGKKIKVRERDFTPEEATAILTAANSLATKARPNQTDLARRWVPWLCAYSGSRVGEMVQLRKEDLRDVDGNWVLTITPEAGTVKGKERRDIPLHPHLVEMGFPGFVGQSKAGYLFMTVKPGKTFRGTWQSKKNRLAEFAREVVKDPNVAPNHGWRHTFKMKGFEADIQEKVLDAICAHAPSTVGRQYGSVSMQTKVDAMAKFPRYVEGS